MWVSQAFPITPLKTRMTLENPHVQKEIHLQMVDVPVSCYCSFRGVRFHANQQTNQPTNQTHSTTTYHEFTWPPLLHYPHLLQVHIGNLNKSWQLPCRERGHIPPKRNIILKRPLKRDMSFARRIKITSDQLCLKSGNSWVSRLNSCLIFFWFLQYISYINGGFSIIHGGFLTINMVVCWYFVDHLMVDC